MALLSSFPPQFKPNYHKNKLKPFSEEIKYFKSVCKCIITTIFPKVVL